ncbi:class I SAM-dependent methyltransferase [Mycobacterium sp. MMS18-G62]
MSTPDAKSTWEERYSERNRIWSGRVNFRLAEVASTRKPGSALDLGCGEGADACWLAERGWRVVAVDISETALQRAAEDARVRGLGDRIDFQQHDLSESFPVGTFDLVSAQYLHSMAHLDRPRIFEQALAAVASDGLLLIVDHAGPPPWAWKMAHDHEFPTVEEVLDSLKLDAAEWETLRAEVAEREASGPDGHTGPLIDNVIVLRRR